MEGGGGPELQKVPDENKIITRSPRCRTYQSLEFANVVYESLRDGLSYLTTWECLVPGKCLDNTGLENFHYASHLSSSNTHTPYSHRPRNVPFMSHWARPWPRKGLESTRGLIPAPSS